MSFAYTSAHALSKLRSLRDQIRLEVHLASMEARSHWEALEARAKKFERSAHNQVLASVSEVEQLQKELQAFLSREQLLSRRRQLLSARKALASEEQELQADRSSDWVDRSVTVEEEELVHQLDEHDRRELVAIDAALARIEAGIYGHCSACGESIGSERLHAMPTALLCAGCQVVAERHAGGAR